MNLFRQAFPAIRHTARHFRHHAQRCAENRSSPTLEHLEDRTLLNNRFIVPVGVLADNVATFDSLRAALTAPGLNGGDIVQLQPGSAPGNIANADIPNLTNLTIQGDPAVSAAEIPV